MLGLKAAWLVLSFNRLSSWRCGCDPCEIFCALLLSIILGRQSALLAEKP